MDNRIGRRRGAGSNQWFPGMIARLVVPVMLIAGSGCEIHTIGALKTALVVRDVESSELLDDFLLLCGRQERERLARPYEICYPTERFVEARIQRMDSGEFVEQPGMMAFEMNALLFSYGEGEDYQYIIFKEGYVPTAFCVGELVWADRNGAPLIINLPRGRSVPLDQGCSWHDPNPVLRKALPLVPAEEPLRQRLMAMAEE